MPLYIFLIMENQEKNDIVVLQQKKRKSVMFWTKILCYPVILLFLCDWYIVFTLLQNQNPNLDDLFWSAWFAVCVIACISFYLIILLIKFIVFLRWFYRSYTNLWLNDIKLEHKPSMVIWWSIIPIINFFYPFILMKELVQKMYQKLEMNPQWIKVNIYRWWGLVMWTWALFKESLRIPEDTFNHILLWWILEMTGYLLIIINAIVLLKIFKNLNVVEDKFLENIKNNTSL